MNDSAITRADTLGNEEAFSDASEPATTATKASSDEVIQDSIEPINAVDAFTFPNKDSVSEEAPDRGFTPAHEIPTAAVTMPRGPLNPSQSVSEAGVGSDEQQDIIVDNETIIDHEILEPVVQEVVNSTEFNVEQPEINRDIFEEEYNTSVQTILDQLDLEAQQIRRVATVQEIIHDEDKAQDDAALKAYLAQPPADIEAQRKVNEIVRKSTVAPAVVSERHHYHIHERIQPVIQREINQTTVVHTTRPVHEVFYRPSHFTHQVVLPTISMDQYKKQRAQIEEEERRKAAAKTSSNEN